MGSAETDERDGVVSRVSYSGYCRNMVLIESSLSGWSLVERRYDGVSGWEGGEFSVLNLEAIEDSASLRKKKE